MTDSICLRCKHKCHCEIGGVQPSGDGCVTGCSRFEPKSPQTNADKIRAMTDEKLASLLCNYACVRMTCPAGELDCEGRMEIGYKACLKRWLDWLQKEADE